MDLRGWQAYACDRALEHDESGALIWSEILLTVARQSGKSFLARGIVLWRMHEGADLFGQPQLVLSAANKLPTAWEVMYKALAWVREEYGDGCVREGNNRPGITLPSGDRWVPLAAKAGAGTGYSSTMLFVDEVWQIAQRVVDDDLEPTLAEAESGQLWLTSTAGDSESELFASRRQKAIEQIDRGDDDDRILLLEWSAPPDAPVEDEETWQWASPEWTEKRIRFITEKFRKSTNIDSFRTQYLNQWVRRIDGWLNSRTYAQTAEPDRQLPDHLTWSVICEVAKDGSSHAVAVAVRDDDGRILIRLHSARTEREVDELVTAIRAGHPATELYITPSYIDRITSQHQGMVGHGQAPAATAALLHAFSEGLISHDASPLLEDQLFLADVKKLDGAYYLVGRGQVSAHGARAVMFAVWQASKVQKPAPKVHVRRPKT
jgi:hypothetical protein